MNARHLGSIRRHLRVLVVSAMASVGLTTIAGQAAEKNTTITIRGFEAFSQGSLEDAGSNLYVNAAGRVSMIHTWDINDDGYPDMILSNSHDHIERAPTRLFRVIKPEAGAIQDRQQLDNESGWASRVRDVDHDGYDDLIILNSENGVTSELSAHIYWGGPDGLSDVRTDLPTTGAYQVACVDLNQDGLLDLVFPSAWVDHHNPGKLMTARVYVQAPGREFKEVTEQYAINGMAALSIAAADLNGDGFADLVLANYRQDFNVSIDSYLYWGNKDGVDAGNPQQLPTTGAKYVITADLNGDGFEEVIFSGTGLVRIYWNRAGKFSPDDRMELAFEGLEVSEFRKKEVQCAVGDLDQDGVPELVMASSVGLEIRSASDLSHVKGRLAVSHLSWVSIADLDADGWPELIASRMSDGADYSATSPIFWNSPEGYSMERVTWVPTQGAVGNAAGNFGGGMQVVYSNTKIGHIKGIHNYAYLGAEDMTYNAERRLDFPTDGTNTSVVADFNHDGHTDVAFAGQPIRVFYGGPAGMNPDDFVELPTNPVLQDLQVADFDRDGWLDLLAVAWVYDEKPKSLARSGTIYFGSPDGFPSGRRQTIPMIGNNAHVADVNKDGWLDIVFTEPHMDRLRIYFGAPEGYTPENIEFVPVVHPTRVTAADLNADGWLDLIVSEGGARIRREDSVQIFYGGSDGYTETNSQKHMGGYYSLRTGVADFNNDGHLDLFVPAYSTPTSRTPLSELFFGDGRQIDFSRPVYLSTMAAAAPIQVDANRDGWIDLFVANHRDDIGHQVDSFLYWNGPDGFSDDHKIRLPGLGPHGTTSRDRGNAYTRKAEESYVSAPIKLAGAKLDRLEWSGETPFDTALKFQLRWASTQEGLDEAVWSGPDGGQGYYTSSGQPVTGAPADTVWVQFKAVFEAPYGCGSPLLDEVQLHLKAL